MSNDRNEARDTTLIDLENIPTFQYVDSNEADSRTFPHERTQERTGLTRRCCLDVMDQKEMQEYLVRLKSISGFPEPDYIIELRDIELKRSVDRSQSLGAMNHRVLYSNISKLKKSDNGTPIIHKEKGWFGRILSRITSNKVSSTTDDDFILAPQWRMYDPTLPNSNEQMRKVDRDKVYNFDTLFRQVIFNFIDYVGELPASESHHHNWPGGLLRHSLEVAEIAMKYAKSQDLKVVSLNDIEIQRRGRWQYGAFVAGLLHDIGKPVTDMVVHVQRSDGNLVIWNPSISSLHQFMKDNNAKSYFVDMNSISKYADNIGRFKHHESLASVLLTKILTPEALSYITTSPDVGYGLMENLTRLLSGSHSDIYLQKALKSGEQISVHASFKKIRSNFHLRDRTNSMAEALSKQLHAIRIDPAFQKNVFNVGDSTFIRYPEGLAMVVTALSKENPQFKTSANLSTISALNFLANANYVRSWEPGVLIKRMQLTEEKVSKKKKTDKEDAYSETQFVPVGRPFGVIMLAHQTIYYGSDAIPASRSAIIRTSDTRAIEFFNAVDCREITFTPKEAPDNSIIKPKSKYNTLGVEELENESELDTAIIVKKGKSKPALKQKDQTEISKENEAQGNQATNDNTQPIENGMECQPELPHIQDDITTETIKGNETSPENPPLEPEKPPATEDDFFALAGTVKKVRSKSYADSQEEINQKAAAVANELFASKSESNDELPYPQMVEKMATWINVTSDRLSAFKEGYLLLKELSQSDFDCFTVGFHVKETNEQGIYLKQSIIADIEIELKRLPPLVIKDNLVVEVEELVPITGIRKKAQELMAQSAASQPHIDIPKIFHEWLDSMDGINRDKAPVALIKTGFLLNQHISVDDLIALGLVERINARYLKIIADNIMDTPKVPENENPKECKDTNESENLNTVEKMELSTPSHQNLNTVDIFDPLLENTIEEEEDINYEMLGIEQYYMEMMDREQSELNASYEPYPLDYDLSLTPEPEVSHSEIQEEKHCAKVMPSSHKRVMTINAMGNIIQNLAKSTKPTPPLRRYLTWLSTNVHEGFHLEGKDTLIISREDWLLTIESMVNNAPIEFTAVEEMNQKLLIAVFLSEPEILVTLNQTKD